MTHPPVHARGDPGDCAASFAFTFVRNHDRNHVMLQPRNPFPAGVAGSAGVQRYEVIFCRNEKFPRSRRREASRRSHDQRQPQAEARRVLMLRLGQGDGDRCELSPL